MRIHETVEPTPINRKTLGLTEIFENCSDLKSVFVEHYEATKSFLDSLEFSIFSITYTQKQIEILLYLLQKKYPLLELNNNQPCIYQSQREKIYYKCMNPNCRDTCKKPIKSLLYNHGKCRRKHDYSCILDDNLDYIHSALCCRTCNRILPQRQADTTLFKDTIHFFKVHRSISMDDQSEHSKYMKYRKVENIVSTNSSSIQVPIATNHLKKAPRSSIFVRIGPRIL
jgi:hypothetical protein